LLVSAWLLWSMLATGMTEAFLGLGIVATGVPAYLVRRACTAGQARRRIA